MASTGHATIAAAFQERMRLHLQCSLQGPLESGRRVIITHATRGSIPGLTTRILFALHRETGLVDAPLLHPDDVPHRRDGYAYAHAASKRDLIVESLRPLKALIVNAFKDGRVLVAGKISQDLVRRVLDGNHEVEKFSIPHPCRWPWVWGAPILAKLRSVIGDSMPNEERFAKILIHALSQAVIARWMRMTRWEREAFSLQRKAAYAALQPEEKERRAKAASAAYAALQPEEKERRAEAARASTCMYWHHAGPIEKLQRVQAMHTYRNTVAGKKAWRAALKAARGRMMPETRVAVFSAMRDGYEPVLKVIKFVNRSSFSIRKYKSHAWHCQPLYAMNWLDWPICMTCQEDEDVPESSAHSKLCPAFFMFAGQDVNGQN